MFKRFFKRQVRKIDPNNVYLSQSKIYREYHDDKKRFSLAIGDAALEVLKAQGDLEFEHIVAIPGKIYEKCRELGFLCKQDKFNCEIDAPNVKNPRTTMLLARPSPLVPMIFGHALLL